VALYFRTLTVASKNGPHLILRFTLSHWPLSLMLLTVHPAGGVSSMAWLDTPAAGVTVMETFAGASG
jgi:hypothetical protein